MKLIVKSKILIYALSIGFCIILFSSLAYIFEKRDLILNIIKNTSTVKNHAEIKKNKHELAKDILNGGYILLFRHAEREKWLDVQKYDSIELLDNLKGEKEYFSKAVCLNSRGLVQAKAMGSIIEKIDLPYHIVVTSPSCRARQTANLAFDGYDYVKNVFLYYGPFHEDKKELWQSVKNEIIKIKIKKDSNIIISAHNGVITSMDMFDRIDSESDYSNNIGKVMKEGGFIVMKNENNKLIFIDVFETFHKFQRNLILRPKN